MNNYNPLKMENQSFKNPKVITRNEALTEITNDKIPLIKMDRQVIKCDQNAKQIILKDDFDDVTNNFKERQNVPCRNLVQNFMSVVHNTIEFHKYIHSKSDEKEVDRTKAERVHHESNISTKEFESGLNENGNMSKEDYAMILISLSEKPVVFNNGPGKIAAAFPAPLFSNHEKTIPLELQRLQSNPIAERNLAPNNVMQCICNVCQKQFTNGHDLEKHILIHKEGKLYTCYACGKSFNWKCNLKMNVLGEKKPLFCRVCRKTFQKKHDIKRQKIIHTGIKSNTCNVCGKSFARLCYLKNHIRIHSGEKPYGCIICGKKFSLKCNLSKHKKIHELKFGDNI